MVIDLADQFSRLPGIGRKSALRLAMHLAQSRNTQYLELSRAIEKVITEMKQCKVCFNMSESDVCEICSDSKRDSSVICVVDSVKDLFAIERTREFEGLYHVLGGNISPLDGIGPSDIRIAELLERMESSEEINEVILANSPTVEGEATAIYLSKLLSKYNIKVSRIAHGVPIGADLDYADEVTLGKSIEKRQTY